MVSSEIFIYDLRFQLGRSWPLLDTQVNFAEKWSNIILEPHFRYTVRNRQYNEARGGN